MEGEGSSASQEPKLVIRCRKYRRYIIDVYDENDAEYEAARANPDSFPVNPGLLDLPEDMNLIGLIDESAPEVTDPAESPLTTGNCWVAEELLPYIEVEGSSNQSGQEPSQMTSQGAKKQSPKTKKNSGK